MKGIHCGPLMPYSMGDLTKHWSRQCHGAWQHQTITWNNVDLSPNNLAPEWIITICGISISRNIVYELVWYKKHIYIHTSSKQFNTKCVNALLPKYITWQHRSGSTLAPSHYLNQCWLIINGLLWNKHKTNFTGCTEDNNLWKEFEIFF